MATAAVARGFLSRKAAAAAAAGRTLLLPRRIVPTSTTFLCAGENHHRRWFSSYPPHEVVGMPSLSPTMESGSIAKWNLGEGESFAPGDILCEVETDKATVDFEAQDEGVVAKILAEAGPDEIQCGHPIVITVEDEGDVAAFKDYVVEAGAGAAAAATEAPASPPTEAPVAAGASAPPPPPAAPTPVAATPAAAPTGGRVVASPRAHTVAKELGLGEISALRIVGTGPGGRVIAQDVREYVPPADDVAAVAAEAVTAAAPAAAPAAAAAAAAAAAPVAPAAPPVPGVGYTDYPLSPAALELAAQLSSSKTNVPHYYLTIDVTLDAMLALRSTLNSALGPLDDDESGISVNDLLVKAAAAAMKTVPSANASWMDSFVRQYDSVDINVVVGSGDAMYAPILRDAGNRGVKSISDGIASAVQTVQDAADLPEDFGAVGTFTVMNFGSFGIKSCAPIVREPQACALALGTIENRIVPNDDEESEDIYKESVMMTATMSLDHRVVDGAVGAQWLAAFKNHVENPATLLL